MDRRGFIERVGCAVLAGIGVFFGRSKHVQALTNDQGLTPCEDELPKGCRNKTKGLSRCKGHSGSCEGNHHVCNDHSTGKGPRRKSCGSGQQFQCTRHGN